MREIVIDRANAISGGSLDLEDLKIIVLMVFWSLEKNRRADLDELFVDEEDRSFTELASRKPRRAATQPLSSWGGPSGTGADRNGSIQQTTRVHIELGSARAWREQSAIHPAPHSNSSLQESRQTILLEQDAATLRDTNKRQLLAQTCQANCTASFDCGSRHEPAPTWSFARPRQHGRRRLEPPSPTLRVRSFRGRTDRARAIRRFDVFRVRSNSSRVSARHQVFGRSCGSPPPLR